jgi:hypothetical protein
MAMLVSLSHGLNASSLRRRETNLAGTDGPDCMGTRLERRQRSSLSPR